MKKKTTTKSSEFSPEIQEYIRQDAEAEKIQRWEVIGIAGMDTACLLISDPCYSLPYGKDDGEKDFEITSRGAVYDTMKRSGSDKETDFGQVNFLKGHAGAGVVVHSPHGDDTVTIWGRLDKLDRVRAVYFSFDDTRPPQT